MPRGVPSGFSYPKDIILPCATIRLCAPWGLWPFALRSPFPNQTPSFVSLIFPDITPVKYPSPPYFIFFWPFSCPWHYNVWELPGLSLCLSHHQTTCSVCAGKVCCLCMCCSGGKLEKVFSAVQKGMRLQLCMTSVLNPTQ